MTSAFNLSQVLARAQAADAAGDRAASAEAWGQLCSAGSSDWRVWSNYAGALATLGRWPECANALRWAADLNPAEPMFRQAAASALAQAGRHDEGADELKLWVEAAPADPRNNLLLARLLADLGRHEESDAQLDAAARLATGEGLGDDRSGLIRIATASGRPDLKLLRELAGLLERTSRLEDLRALIGQAEALGIDRKQLGYPAAAIALKDGDPAEAKGLLLADDPEGDPVRWHWLMARIADAQGDSEAAFAEAEAMNRSSNGYAGWRERCRSHLHWLRGLADTVTPEWADRIQQVEPGTRRSPAFLVGFPRSGTTLLDTFLMGHPNVAVLEEVPVIHAIEVALGNIAELPDRTRDQLAKARDAYFAELDKHVDPEFDGLVVDKLPLNLLAVPFLRAVFPDSPIVFAQRHPCDCVLSCFMQGFALNASMACFLDIRDAAEFYDSALTLWTRCRETLPLKVHTLVYEELIADPQASLRPLVDFLGLDWSDELLDHRATAKARGAISTPSYDQVVQPLNDRASGRWRRYEQQLGPALPLLLPWAERLGYSK